MSKEEELLECWQDLTADQQEEVLNFLKTLKQQTVAERSPSLGQRLRIQRQRIVASGTSLLTWDDLEAEVAARRGGESSQEA